MCDSQGGDTLHEALTANVTEDTVQLQFQRADGTVVTQFLDFQREVLIYRLMVLTEEEQVLKPLRAFISFSLP